MDASNLREQRSPAESRCGEIAMKCARERGGDPVRLRQCQSDKSEWNRGVFVPRLLIVGLRGGVFAWEGETICQVMILSGRME